MVDVRPITAADFDTIFPLLDELDDEQGKAVWRNVIDYPWTNPQTHSGYALFDGEKPVGIHAFIFSERTIDGEAYQFCNLTSWFLKEEYRGYGLSLILPLRKMKNITITDLSAGDNVVPILKRFGFKELENSVEVLLPCRPWKKASTLKIYHEKEIDSAPLTQVEQKIYQHHRKFDHSKQLVIEDGDQHAHIIFSAQKKSELPYNYIHSISNLSLFEKHQMLGRRQIMEISGVPLTIVDTRLTGSVDFKRSYTLPKLVSHLYRSPTLSPPEIDNLYSELTILDFDTSEGLKLGIREKILKLSLPAMKILFSI